jgi:hypothetical protein
VVRVAPEALEQLQQRIQTLGQRARRLGVEPVRLIDTGERDASGNALVLLSGREPMLAGWTLAAIVDHRDGRATVRPVGEQGDRLPGPAPHALRRQRGHRAQPLSPTMNRISRWRLAAPEPVPGPMTPRERADAL